MQFTPSLSFQGQCARAFDPYAELFGGDLDLSRFSDIPAGDAAPEMRPEQTGWIMHATLTLPDGATLMGADMPPQFGGTKMQPGGMAVAETIPDADRARAVFERLSQGGQVTMAFGPTFFAQGFGMCSDAFGTPWMVSAGEG